MDRRLWEYGKYRVKYRERLVDDRAKVDVRIWRCRELWGGRWSGNARTRVKGMYITS